MPKVYPTDIIELGLQILAATGSSTITAGRMKAQGKPVPRRTLENWRDQAHRERYAAICSDIAPKIRERMAAEAESVIDTLTDLEHKAAARLADQIPHLEGKELGNTLRSVSTSKGINLTHAAALRDRPALIVEHKHTVDQLDQALAALGITGADTVESTAVEMDADHDPRVACGQLPDESRPSERAHATS